MRLIRSAHRPGRGRSDRPRSACPSASAGEAQGNSSAGNINETGMRGHANSICAFSGQNPERFLDPSDPNYEPGRVQSWGQIPKAIRDIIATQGEHPGDTLQRPHRLPRRWRRRGALTGPRRPARGERALAARCCPRRREARSR